MLISRTQLLLLSCLLFVSNQSWGISQVLQEIQFVKVARHSAIQIKITLPADYISHYPISQAKSLNIQIRLHNENQINFNELPILETLLPPANKSSILKDVSYITENEQTKLVVNFYKPIRYNVSQSNPQTLLIELISSSKPHSKDKPAVIKKDSNYTKNILNRGKTALKNGKNAMAIEIFSQLVSGNKHAYTQTALELLGIARERNGQIAQAKVIYEKYLKQYKTDEASVRVRQRLAEMISNQLQPKKKLKSSRTKRASNSLTSGTISQYYYFGQHNLPTPGSNIDQSLLVSQISTNWRKRADTYEMRSFFYANNSYDLESQRNDGIEISSLYWKLKHFRKKYSVILGRQSGNSGGLLGRFDGIHMGASINSKIRLNTVFGYPVDVSDKTNIQTHRPFFNLHVELNNMWKDWDIIPYYISQKIDHLIDREALGTEIHLFQKQLNFYALFDYDLSFGDLNIMTQRGQYKYSDFTFFNISLDYRKSPLLETANALSGQTGAQSIDELSNTLSKNDIYQLAKLRTGDSTMLSMGITHSLTKDTQFNSNISFGKQHLKSDDPVNMGAIISTKDSQKYISGQLIINKLASKKDAAIATLRQANTNTYDETSLTLAHRYPIKREWRIDTRIRRSNKKSTNKENLKKLKPSVKLDYRYNKSMRLLFDFSVEWWKYSGITSNRDFRRIAANLGYRWLF